MEPLHTQVAWDEALVHDLRHVLRLALLEDLDRSHDWTTVSLVPATAHAMAQVITREAGVVAGAQVGAVLLDEMASSASWQIHTTDGSRVAAGARLATMEGPARDILVAERTCLNTIGHLSGIASLTRQYVDAIVGTNAQICGTRKTLPGWRRLQKFAIRCGGGVNHRLALYDAVLIKDNHIAFGKQQIADSKFDVREAVERSREFLHHQPETATIVIEVEVDSLEQLQRALLATPDIVLLDNMTPEQLSTAVSIKNETAPGVQLEASGGITLQTVRAVAETGVDRISIGALTHSAKHLDVGLDWDTGS